MIDYRIILRWNQKVTSHKTLRETIKLRLKGKGLAKLDYDLDDPFLNTLEAKKYGPYEMITLRGVSRMWARNP